MLKLVIIDLDDTIINYSQANSIAFQNLFNELQKLSNTKYEDIIRFHKDIKNNLNILYNNQFICHDKLLQIKLLCNRLKINDIIVMSNLYDIYEKTFLDTIKLHHKCCEFLQLCKTKNIKVCIITNNLLHIQLKVFEKLNLNYLVDTMFTSNEFFYEKPHKESLEYILNHYEVSKNETIIIGDSIANDIAWGEINGINTILCDNKCKQTSFYNCIDYIMNLSS
jgi:HAD superfamily hydrolase (TIGR01549 family)